MFFVHGSICFACMFILKNLQASPIELHIRNSWRITKIRIYSVLLSIDTHCKKGLAVSIKAANIPGKLEVMTGQPKSELRFRLEMKPGHEPVDHSAVKTRWAYKTSQDNYEQFARTGEEGSNIKPKWKGQGVRVSPYPTSLASMRTMVECKLQNYVTPAFRSCIKMQWAQTKSSFLDAIYPQLPARWAWKNLTLFRG